MSSSNDTLRLIVLDNCKEFGSLVNEHIKSIRNSDCDYRVPILTPRFNNGEGKGQVLESIRGKDVYIISDIGNHGITYKSHGYDMHMSPDEHFQDIKRIIGAMMGHASSIKVIMPLLYCSRQDKRESRESLDCAINLQELERLGVNEIITFDVHNKGVQNAIPLLPFSNLFPTKTALYDFIINEKIDLKNLTVVGPDLGSSKRANFYANILKCPLGLCYKDRDYTKVEDGQNKMKTHKYIGEDVKDKNVIIVDDMIDSGGSILDTAKMMKNRGAKEVYLMVTFSFFSKGIEMFDEAYKNNCFTKIYSTNVSYIKPEAVERPWLHIVDCSKDLALVIDTLNKQESITPLMNGKRELAKTLQLKRND